MKRNTMFGGLALLAAGAAIGVGAMVSSNAMAATGEPAPTDQLTMVSAGSDGDAFRCTFEGADVEGLLPELPAGAPVDVPMVGDVFVGSGEIMSTDGSLPEGALESELTVVAGEVPVGADGQPVTPVPGGAPVQIFGVDDVREGTDAECAALHDQGVAMASQVIGGTGTAVEP